MPRKTLCTLIVCVTILAAVYMLKDRLCGLTYHRGNTEFSAQFVYEAK